jgi:hypothetical protein
MPRKVRIGPGAGVGAPVGVPEGVRRSSAVVSAALTNPS